MVKAQQGRHRKALHGADRRAREGARQGGDEVRSAIKTVLKKKIEAAVDANRLTRAQADRRSRASTMLSASARSERRRTWWLPRRTGRGHFRGGPPQGDSERPAAPRATAEGSPCSSG